MKNPDGILFSLAREIESVVQKILEVSQKRMPPETESTLEKSFRTSKTKSDTMRASRKLSVNSEKMHISTWTSGAAMKAPDFGDKHGPASLCLSSTLSQQVRSWWSP